MPSFGVQYLKHDIDLNGKVISFTSCQNFRKYEEVRLGWKNNNFVEAIEKSLIWLSQYQKKKQFDSAP